VKIENQVWIIYPEDAKELLAYLITLGYSIEYDNKTWVIKFNGKRRSPYDYEKRLTPGPYAEAAIESMVLIDQERIFAHCKLYGFELKKIKTNRNIYFVYNPDKKSIYLNLFARHKKHLNLP
jgi:hypothetical protein